MMSARNAVNAAEKVHTMLRSTFMRPAALQPDVIMEATTPAEANVTATPQSVNRPITVSELTAITKKIDVADSATIGEATSCFIEADKKTSRNARRALRVSPTTPPSSTPTSTAAGRQRDVDEHNRLNSNLFIRNLDADVDQAELDKLFRAYGTILSSAVMRDIHTGQSLGTAFVRMSTHEEARVAMQALHNHPVRSKAILVQWAKRHDGAPVGEARKKIMKLFVRNIPLDCSVEALEALFGQFGCVRQVTLHKDTALVEDAALERLIAFVIYTEEGAAERAATAMHNTRPFPSCNGIPIMIKLAEDQARHDRARPQRYTQPVSPQQYPPRRCFHETADGSEEAAAAFDAMRRSPKSTSSGSDYNTTSSRSATFVVTGGVASTELFDFQPGRAVANTTTTAATYLPPSVLLWPGNNAVMVRSGRQCTLPDSNASVRRAVVPLCSPLTPPLAVHAAHPFGATSLCNGCVAGSRVDGQQQQQRPAMDLGYARAVATSQPLLQRGGSHALLQIATPAEPNSMRSSSENSGDGSGVSHGGVAIPNPRSVALAAARRRRINDTACAGAAQTTARSALSACLSLDSGSAPVSPAVAADEIRSLPSLLSPLKYRHNPYSMSSSVSAC
ncbi:putative RNA binding protein [Leptomonas pyrrhocoris]|uniref:Putative RNA binding protein n=1 Tax=Leptomonas pyrrhocoris TaxID=157538 RepID=A0A0N0DVK9_LEPPY|nr:putative RNA binding protein [Leptomonas pyrrhocoris]KPA80492.1 putative RNA binding protein [Leptomonas pyrrhocoris]|eukprot:XP_015658931.1 putative RNA binding protein [Leptomonas pyrrhocoris]